MKRIFLFIACFLSGAAAFAQSLNTDDVWSNIDLKEDSAEIMTIADIINEQQGLTNRNLTEMHFADVWSRRKYFNIAFNWGKLTPSEPVSNGLDGGNLEAFSSNWGIVLQSGRSYNLHKKPIANTLLINIDVTGLDFSVTHYSAVGAADDGKIYNSSLKTADGHYRMPWNLEKYEASYGLCVGPSLTVAPFNYLDIEELHYIKLHLYFHVGYQFSIAYMLNNGDGDRNTSVNKKDFDQMSSNLKMTWGHGLYTSFGFNLSWKSIGLGFETRRGPVTHRSFNIQDFGDIPYEFSSSYSRLYINLRLSK